MIKGSAVDEIAQFEKAAAIARSTSSVLLDEAATRQKKRLK